MNFRLVFFNFWWTLYFKLTFWSASARIKINKELNREGLVVVSFTTKPSRIFKTWLVVESILRQTRKPDAIILYLARDEFNDQSCIPPQLLKLQTRGLQIEFVAENLKPHNKYFYSLKKFPHATIITIDDDKIYPPTLVETLIKASIKYPSAVCATMTRRIRFSEQLAAPYSQWEITRMNTSPEHALVSLGVCGVLYPPLSLSSQVFNIEMIREKALFTDDLWIKVMALRNNTKVVSVAGEFPKPFTSIRGLNTEQLTTVNIGQGKNDEVFKALIEYYNIELLDIINQEFSENL